LILKKSDFLTCSFVKRNCIITTTPLGRRIDPTGALRTVYFTFVSLCRVCLRSHLQYFISSSFSV
jgi:hypothetical protein